MFEGQLEDPDAPGHRLYPTRFCRECGHEVHVVTRAEETTGFRFLPRNIDDTPISDAESDVAGYLTPVQDDAGSCEFSGEVESYPEDWREERNGVERLRSSRNNRIPEKVSVGLMANALQMAMSSGSSRVSSGFASAVSISRIPACVSAANWLGYRRRQEFGDDTAGSVGP